MCAIGVNNSEFPYPKLNISKHIPPRCSPAQRELLTRFTQVQLIHYLELHILEPFRNKLPACKAIKDGQERGSLCKVVRPALVHQNVHPVRTSFRSL